MYEVYASLNKLFLIIMCVIISTIKIGNNMLHIIRSALVPYSAEQMFALVNDISAYQKFIPGCTSSRVLKKSSCGLIAEINVSKAGITKSLITYNVIIENKNIMMRLVEGPFSAFIGNWFFIPLSEGASTVRFYLDFEFKNNLIEAAFSCIFKEMVNDMIMAFTRRAKEIYLDISQYKVQLLPSKILYQRELFLKNKSIRP